MADVEIKTADRLAVFSPRFRDAAEVVHADERARLVLAAAEGNLELATKILCVAMAEQIIRGLQPTAVRDVGPDLFLQEAEGGVGGTTISANGANTGPAGGVPTRNVTGFVGFLSGDVGRLFATGPDNNARAWSIAPTVSWAAFDMGSVRARLRASQAQSDAAAANYEKVVLTAQIELLPEPSAVGS